MHPLLLNSAGRDVTRERHHERRGWGDMTELPGACPEARMRRHQPCHGRLFVWSLIIDGFPAFEPDRP